MRCEIALSRIRPLKCRMVKQCRKHFAHSSFMQMICLIDSLCRMRHVRHCIRHLPTPCIQQEISLMQFSTLCKLENHYANDKLQTPSHLTMLR